MKINLTQEQYEDLITSNIQLPSYIWIALFEIEDDITDYDGWNRDNLKNSLSEPIRLSKFLHKLFNSTARFCPTVAYLTRVHQFNRENPHYLFGHYCEYNNGYYTTIAMNIITNCKCEEKFLNYLNIEKEKRQ